MDIDTLIYIIIMIVFIILGALGKKKPVPRKTDQEMAMDEEEVPPEDIIARKLKAFLGEYDEEPKSVPDDENIYADYPEISTRSDYATDSYKEPDVKYTKPTIVAEKVSEHFDISVGIDDDDSPVFEHENTDNELTEGDLTKQADPHSQELVINGLLSEFSTGLDARKAIIYSEIINRKYT